MSAEEKQHDRMASRLAIIISRLLMGEQLSVQALSLEFQISERTLRRDFRERLSCLELTYRQGNWSLAQPLSGIHTNRAILHFARATSIEQLFPAMDNKLIAVLTDSSIPSPYIVWLSPPGRKPTPFGGFWRITQAILDRTLLDLTVDTEQYRWFAPYRLIYGTVAKLAMRQPFVLFKGLTFQKLCLPGAFRPGDHHNKMLRPGLCVVHASPQYL
ncbi:DeoR family transcriptional regulator [Enterobacter cloacae complex sp.]|uniref:DeoR family transcriptional regulator n=2 Tax=Enterobacter cloacae complex TaxID=354276 RepID=UPI0020B1563D|nr:DeoR family transcriptional regulator [Enterobacter cloacae complex sp.]